MVVSLKLVFPPLFRSLKARRSSKDDGQPPAAGERSPDQQKSSRSLGLSVLGSNPFEELEAVLSTQYDLSQHYITTTTTTTTLLFTNEKQIFWSHLLNIKVLTCDENWKKWICLEKEKTKIEKQHYLDEILCLPVQFFSGTWSLGRSEFSGTKKTYFSDQKLFIFIEFNLHRRCIIQITRSLYIYPCSCTVPSITVINLRSLRLYFCFMVVPYTGCYLKA